MRATAVVSVTWFGMWIGYLVVPNRGLRRTSPLARPSPSIYLPQINAAKGIWYATAVLRVLLTGMGLRGFISGSLLDRGTFRPIAQLLGFVDFMNVAALIVVGFEVFGDKGSNNARWLVGAIAGEVFLGLLHGSRAMYLNVLFALFASHYYAQRRYSWRIPIVIVLAATLSVSMATAFRYQRPTERGFLAPFQALAAARESTSALTLRNRFDDAVDLLLRREGGALQMIGAVMSRHPYPLPFLGLQSVIELPLKFIPRIIWPGKPIAPGGTEITDLYTVHAGQGSTSSSAVTLYGDFYRHGSWAFAFVGGWFWGLALGLAYRQVLLHARRVDMCAYLVLLFFFLTTETDFIRTVQSLVQKLPIVLLLVYHVLYVPKRSRGVM